MVEEIPIEEIVNEENMDMIDMACDQYEEDFNDWIEYEQMEQKKIDDKALEEIAEHFTKWINKHKKVTKEDVEAIIGVIKLCRRLKNE